MAEAYRLYRFIFIHFNNLLVTVGGLTIIVSMTLLAPTLDDFQKENHFAGETTSHIALCIAGCVTMVIGILGVCGGMKNNLPVLNIFLASTLIGSLLILRAGVTAAIARPKLETMMEERWRLFLPLDQAPEDVRHQAEALQRSLQCCGLFRYDDWGRNIPDSCLCHLDQEVEDRCQQAGYKNFLVNLFWKRKIVYKQNCFPLIMDSVTTNANVTLLVLFTLLVLGLLGLVLASLMIYRMNVIDSAFSPSPTPLPSAGGRFFEPAPPSYSQSRQDFNFDHKDMAP